MSFSLFRTPEREDRYKLIGPIAEDAIYFFKNADNPIEINSLDDAKKVELIACRHSGLVYSSLVEHGFENLDPVSNPSEIIQKIVFG